MPGKRIDYQVGLEELVAAISLLGQPQVAKALLWSHTGELSEDEERGRLIAAHHSLLAHELATLNQGEIQLTPEFGAWVQFLIRHDWVLRFNRVGSEGEQVLAFYFQAGQILRHQMSNGFTHQLSPVQRSQIAADGARFLGITDIGQSYSEAEVSQSVMDEARVAARAGCEAVEAVLAGAGVPANMRPALALDLCQSEFRGSLLRVHMNDGALQSDQGYLLLGGVKRVWLLEVLTREAEVFNLIQPATPARLAQAVKKLSR